MLNILKQNFFHFKQNFSVFKISCYLLQLRLLNHTFLTSRDCFWLQIYSHRKYFYYLIIDSLLCGLVFLRLYHYWKICYIYSTYLKYQCLPRVSTALNANIIFELGLDSIQNCGQKLKKKTKNLIYILKVNKKVSYAESSFVIQFFLKLRHWVTRQHNHCLNLLLYEIPSKDPIHNHLKYHE